MVLLLKVSEALGQAAQNGWRRDFALPAFFVFLGARLGFVLSQIRDYFQAKRAKKSFLRAIDLELDALGRQLGDSLTEVTESGARLDAGGSTGPQFAASLRTSVFTSQLASSGMSTIRC